MDASLLSLTRSWGHSAFTTLSLRLYKIQYCYSVIVQMQVEWVVTENEFYCPLKRGFILLTNFILAGNFLSAIGCKGKSEIPQTSRSPFSLFKVIILQGKKDFVLLLLFEPEEGRGWSVKYRRLSLVRIPWDYISEQQGREKLVKIMWRCCTLTSSAHFCQFLWLPQSKGFS